MLDMEVVNRFPSDLPITLDITDAALGLLKEKYAMLPDPHTTAGYEFLRLGIAEIRGLRGKVTARHKELKADALAFGRKVDARKNEIIDTLTEIENPMKAAKSEVDAEKKAKAEAKKRKEAERKEAILLRIDGIRQRLIDATSKPSVEIAMAVAELEEVIIDNSYQEFEISANRVKHEITIKLKELYEETVRREAEDREREAENKRLEEARLKLEEQEKEAAAKAAEAEAKQLEEEARLEAEREKFRQEQAIANEKARLKKEAEKKVARDLQVARENRKATVDAIEEIVLDSQKSEVLYEAIKDGEIPHVGLV